jgi:hypothetical protein
MRVVSADSHTVEPAELWTSRLDRRFRDRAPHIETRGSTALLFAPGIRPVAAGAGFRKTSGKRCSPCWERCSGPNVNQRWGLAREKAFGLP